MPKLVLLTTLLVCLAALPESAQASSGATAVAKSKTSSLDAKLQAQFRSIAKGVDGLSAELRSVKKAKGATRAKKLASLKRDLLSLQSRTKRLGALGKKAKVAAKTNAAIGTLQRHLRDFAALAGAGLKSAKAVGHADDLARRIVDAKAEVAGLVEPIVFR